MLWIVSGPSSVGKSTFLASERCRELTGLAANAPILYAFEERAQNTLTGDAYLHYNLLRPVARFRRELSEAARTRSFLGRIFAGVSETRAATWQKEAGNFQSDPAWRNIITQETPKKAIVLVGDTGRILERVRERCEIERSMPEGRKNVYQSDKWLELYERIDLGQLYRDWCDHLEACGIDYCLVDSNDLAFRIRMAL